MSERTPQHSSDLTRFERHYIPIPESGCWLWTGAVARGGYGHMSMRRKTVKAHRLSWELHRFPISDSQLVLHRCDVRCCVNPDHLFLGTHTDNALDRVKKGRNGDTANEKNPHARFSNSDVLEMRAAASGGEETHAVLAKRFGCTRSYFSQVVRGDARKGI